MLCGVRGALAYDKMLQQAHNAVGMKPQTSYTSAFSVHLTSLVTTLRTIFQRMFPTLIGIAFSEGVAESQSSVDCAEEESRAALAVISGALLLLGAAASSNPGTSLLQSSE